MPIKFSLTPNVTPSAWSRHNNPKAKEANAEFAQIRPQALKRDKFICQGCSLHIKTDPPHRPLGLEVHHIDHHPEHNHLENLVTLCPLCHGTQHLGFFNRTFKHAMRIIWCPEISQGDLNYISWFAAIFLYQNRNEHQEISHKINKLINKLLARTTINPDEAKFASLWKYIQRDPGSSAAAYGHLIGQLRQRNHKLFEQREKWLGAIKIFYNPKLYRIFEAYNNANLISRLANYEYWHLGPNWFNHWQKIKTSCQELNL